jgi:hypothetical protein
MGILRVSIWACAFSRFFKSPNRTMPAESLREKTGLLAEKDARAAFCMVSGSCSTMPTVLSSLPTT